jgi:hypothetical protein
MGHGIGYGQPQVEKRPEHCRKLALIRPHPQGAQKRRCRSHSMKEPAAAKESHRDRKRDEEHGEAGHQSGQLFRGCQHKICHRWQDHVELIEDLREHRHHVQADEQHQWDEQRDDYDWIKNRGADPPADPLHNEPLIRKSFKCAGQVTRFDAGAQEAANLRRHLTA